MQLHHEFTLPIPFDQAWDALLDVERIAPCMPGAMLDHVDGDVFTGRVTLKVGPLRLTYRGEAQIKEKDRDQRRLVIVATGQETRGSGTAQASVTAALESTSDGTRVALVTDLDLTGRPAQFGRGLVNEVAGTIIDQFADRLCHEMTRGDAPQQVLAAAPEHIATGSESTTSNRADTREQQRDDNALDALTLLRATTGHRGLMAIGALAGLVIAFLLGRRARAGHPSAAPPAQPPLPAVYVIDAGTR
ncbi:SRPBCC family protein [Haloactinopolyspora sp.]|uniref:SRPBCC family protein n=1 Tax=Haloactinopolyspora sp. TaxID=1966353 RepID=UPI0026141F3F|nr:SRPBCC family protein [Haloactinopolyspora sp.]